MSLVDVNPMFQQNDQLVRQLEAELLDKNHLTFKLLLRSQQTAVSHLLKILGDLLREYETGETDCSWSVRQTIANLTMEAAEHAIRWVLTKCVNGIHEPGEQWKEKDDEAIELLVWAIQYAQ